jgi:hypothetical protein
MSLVGEHGSKRPARSRKATVAAINVLAVLNGRLNRNFWIFRNAGLHTPSIQPCCSLPAVAKSPLPESELRVNES